jgi:hypothetical protein
MFIILMEQIEKLNEKINIIEKLEDIDLKSKSVKEVKTEIKEEKEKVEEMIQKISETTSKKHKKFKGMNLEELATLFDNEDDLQKKLKIYEHIVYLIEKTKNQLFEEV